MYDPYELLRLIDAQAPWILGGFAVAMVFQTVWLVECIRLARRQRVYTMPLFCTFFWFAHDTACVARFREWFVTYDHWFLKCFWLGLLSAVVLEVIFFVQVVRYGREEILPGVSPRAFIAGLVVVQVGASVVWELFKYLLHDPLYQYSPMLTLISYPIFGVGLLLRRRSTLGQNLTMWAAYCGITTAWIITTGVWYGPAFRTWQYLGAGVVALAGGSAMCWVVSGRSRLFAERAVAVPA